MDYRFLVLAESINLEMLFSKRVGTCGGVTKIVFHCMTQDFISRHYENYMVCYDVTLQHTALHCNRHIESPRMFCNRGCGAIPLQHTAAHCNSLQPVVTRCSTLQHTAAHCNTLQHTATHCNTLQHTATHCNKPAKSSRVIWGGVCGASFSRSGHRRTQMPVWYYGRFADMSRELWGGYD